MSQLARILIVLFLFVGVSSRVEGASFDSDGVKIHYEVMGEGPPVLLVHGYMASGNMNWRVPGVAKLLAPNYRVILIDNRGHGESDKPTQPSDYGAKMTDDSVRLLDHLGIPKAHWVGYSMGGMITLNACVRYPDRLLSGVIGGMGWLKKGPITDEERPGRATLRPLSPALQACARAFPDLGITREQLHDIKTPITVVVGSADQLYEMRVKPLMQVRPDIPVVLVPEGTHITCLFKPTFKESIKDWLDRQPKP